MSTNLEIEFKNMLTKTEYQQLMNHFNPQNLSLITQQNIYYDTANASLKQLKSALRIRIKNETYELTLKLPQSIGLLEINQSLTADDVWQFNNHKKLPPGAVVDALISHNIDVSHLNIITDLITKRFECPYEGGLLVLDESFYHEITDYELEYEVTDYDIGHHQFQTLLNHYHIPLRPAKSKIKRAIDAMTIT